MVLQLLVGLSSGRVHCWDWNALSLSWESGVSFVCCGGLGMVSVAWSSEYGSLVCLEASDELV